MSSTPLNTTLTSLFLLLHPSLSHSSSSYHYYHHYYHYDRLDTRGGQSTTAVFSLVEANQFKELTHLSLHLRPGNDTSVKVRREKEEGVGGGGVVVVVAVVVLVVVVVVVVVVFKEQD